MQYPKILHIHNLIVAVLVTSVGATAQAASLSSQFYLPETSFIAALPEIQSMPDLSSIRVHVFPHLLTYSTPQGAEKIVDRITLTSKGSCLEQIGNHAFNKIPSPMHFTFAGLTEVKEPIKIQCTLPITVEREAGLESFSYRGVMIVKISNDPVPGTLEVLNVISLEDYLKGVVPSEMPTTWSEEILKVQAVAARTYAALTADTSAVGRAFVTALGGNGQYTSNRDNPFVGRVHQGYQLNYRQNVTQYSMQINATTFGGQLEVDIDYYNPATWGGLLAHLDEIDQNSAGARTDPFVVMDGLRKRGVALGHNCKK